jgi:hypothetical protein
MVVTGFVQVIELKTSRVEEMRSLVAQMRAEYDPGAAVRGSVTADRDRPGHYYTIVEFESYEAAMRNSTRPEVSAYAARLAALCDERRAFYNLMCSRWGTAKRGEPTERRRPSQQGGRRGERWLRPAWRQSVSRVTTARE